MSPIRVRIRTILDEAVDIRSFELETLDGSLLPAIIPGAHVDVHLHAGLTRQYSLCNGPGPTDSYVLAVKREAASRGGSAAMHALAEGDLIEISAPRDNFTLHEGPAQDILLAGGIGITPLLSMARHLAAAERPFELHYFARSMEHAAFHRLLGVEPLARHVRFHFGLDPDQSERRLKEILTRPASGTLCYVCGPAPFIAGARMAAEAAGWPEDSVRAEHFGAKPSAKTSDRAFEVVLARAGTRIRVGADESIIRALAREGAAVEVSCEMGICGTCLTTVLEGVPDHRDEFLSDHEKTSNAQMCLCVSRSQGLLLVLDL